MITFNEYIKNSNVKLDSDGVLDASYGKEFLEKHNVTTFKNEKTIFSDTRLQKLFSIVLSEAIEDKATDILIRPEDNFGLVYHRVGREMKVHRILHKGAVESFVTFMRKTCGINPEQIKRGESAKYTFSHYQDEETYTDYDTRFQFHPTDLGSSVGIRVFYQDTLNRSIDDLGFADLITYHYKNTLKLREGLILVSGPTGSGKALSLNTEIPMFEGGFKKLSSIKTGDVILDNNGNPTNVLAIYDHEGNDCFKLKLSDGSEVIADSSHNWFVYSSENNSLVKTTHELYNDKNNDYWIPNIGHPVKYQNKPVPLDPKSLGISLGFCTKFNSLQTTLTQILGETEEHVLLKIKEVFSSDEIMIPEQYLYNSPNIRKELLEGIIAGVSSRLNHNYHDVIEDLSDKMLYQTKQLAESLGKVVLIKNKKLIITDEVSRKIVEITPVKTEPTRCLTVDSTEHLFLFSKEYIVTHNTTTEYVGILQILQESGFTSNIFTIEDPIEYKIRGITQSEVDNVNGFTFGEATKSFLRMNPDVILVGEIRDDETAKAVTRASTSGHLAISTVHANSTLEVLSVLKQYGVHQNDIINAVKLVLYQVLEEKLCPHCRKNKILSPHQKSWVDKKLIGMPELAIVYEKNEQGCSSCNYKGVNGRVMLNEMLVTGFEFRVLQEEYGQNIDELKRALINSEEKLFYPIEWDVHRRIKDGDIDFETATRLIH